MKNPLACRGLSRTQGIAFDKKCVNAAPNQGIEEEESSDASAHDQRIGLDEIALRVSCIHEWAKRC